MTDANGAIEGNDGASRVEIKFVSKSGMCISEMILGSCP